jgi:hypothetical protein
MKTKDTIQNTFDCFFLLIYTDIKWINKLWGFFLRKKNVYECKYIRHTVMFFGRALDMIH